MIGLVFIYRNVICSKCILRETLQPQIKTKKTGYLCAYVFKSTIADVTLTTDVVNSSPSSSFYVIAFVVSVFLALFVLTKYFLMV